MIKKLGLNPMESAGCFSIIKALQKNPNTKLEQLDFSEIIVDRYYKDEFKNFQTVFPHIQVKTGSDEMKLKPKVKIHPIVKIKNFTEKKKLKILDFFAEYDKNSSMSVSRNDFINAINNLGIHLSDDEIEQMLRELDADGHGDINYRFVFFYRLRFLFI
jgi:hypothetical protein